MHFKGSILTTNFEDNMYYTIILMSFSVAFDIYKQSSYNILCFKESDLVNQFQQMKFPDQFLGPVFLKPSWFAFADLWLSGMKTAFMTPIIPPAWLLSRRNHILPPSLWRSHSTMEILQMLWFIDLTVSTTDSFVLTIFFAGKKRFPEKGIPSTIPELPSHPL